MTPSTVHKNSAEAIWSRALQLGIGAENLEQIEPGLVHLKYGNHEEVISFAMSSQTSVITNRIMRKKYLTDYFLTRFNLPSPAFLWTDDINEAKKFLAQYKKIVVKPADGKGGAGVTPGITNEFDLQIAIDLALTSSKFKSALLQQHIEGHHFRILVIDFKHVFALERTPANVIGNGQSTVEELITKKNVATKAKKFWVKIDNALIQHLAQQGCKLEDIPPLNTEISLSLVSNASFGGTTKDVTAKLGNSVKKKAIEVAKKFSCPCLGIDVISPTIENEFGIINELNSSPSLIIHLYPNEGEAQDVVTPFIAMLYPELGLLV
jgi:cyanophycin synthetase